METNHPRERKKTPFFWIIVVVAVLLAGALALYTGLMRTQPARVAAPAVARGKIPPMPPSPSMEYPAGPSTSSEAAPPTDAGGRENATGARSHSELEPRLAASVADGPREDAAGMKSDTTASSQESSATDTGEGTMDDSEQAGPSDDQAPAADSGDSQTASTADEEPQAAIHTAPASAPPSDSAARQSSNPSATEAAPDQAALPPSAPETVSAFAIQVGAFRTKSNADRQVAQLREKGFDAFLHQQDDKKQRVWYLVRFGRFENFNAADQALAAFKDREHMDGAVVRSNSK